MAFLPFLSGLASGVSDSYGKISEEKRQLKASQNKLVADSLKERLSKDDTLTPEEQTHLLDQYLDLHGVDKKAKQQIIDASGYFRNALTEHQRKTTTDDARAAMQRGPAALTDVGDQPAPESIGDVPVFRTQGTSFAPEIPQFQPKTSGQLNFEEKQPRVEAAEHAKQNAIREEARQASAGLIDDKIEILKKYKGTPYESEVRRMVGAAPPNTGAFKTQSAVRGHAVADYYKMKGMEPPQGLNPNGLYNLMLTPDQMPAGFVGQEEDAVASSPAQGASFVGMFDQDLAGNPLNPAASYVPLHAKKGGDLLGLVPAAQYGTSNTQINWKIITQADGTQVARPFTETSVTEKTANGQAVQNTPGVAPTAGIPSMPVGAPGGQTPTATGVSAVTAGGPQAGFGNATPATPLPKKPTELNMTPPRLQGPDPYKTKVGVGIVVGGKPLTRDEDRARNNSLQALRAISRVRAAIKKDPKVLAMAAIPGSLGARLFDQARNEIMDVLTRERTGAALNDDEMQFYRKQMVGLMDLASEHLGEKGVIEDKLKLYEDLFNAVVQQYGRRAVTGYTPDQLSQLVHQTPPSMDEEAPKGKGATPKTPLPNAPKGAEAPPTIEEIRRQLRGGK